MAARPTMFEDANVGAARDGSDAEAGVGNYRVYALILLTAIYASNYADQMILSVLMPAIKAEFGLSDAAMGFLSGTVLSKQMHRRFPSWLVQLQLTSECYNVRHLDCLWLDVERAFNAVGALSNYPLNRFLVSLTVPRPDMTVPISPLIRTYISSRCHFQCLKPRIRLTRWRRISAANSGPNLFHQSRTVS